MNRRCTTRRLLAGLTVGVLLAGCAGSAGSASPTTAPVATTSASVPSVAPASVPSVAPTPDMTAAPSATPVNLGATWTASAGLPWAVAVTAGIRGWVAVGSARPVDDPGSEYAAPAAWASTDGSAWTRSTSVAMPTGTNTGEMTAVTSAATGLFAAGTVNLTAGTVWRSVDGSTWDVIGSGPLFDLGPCVEGCASLTSIAAGPAGIVVTGYRVIPPAPPTDVKAQSVGVADAEHRVMQTASKVGIETDTWHSADGTSWQRVPVPTVAAAVPAAEMSVVARDGGFIAAGSLCESNGTTCRAVTWTSADGRAWAPPVDLPNGTGARALQLATGPGGNVVLGMRCDKKGCRSAVWASADGATWKEGTLVGDFVEGSTQLASAGDRFMVLSSKDGEVAVWTSSDGLEWAKLTVESGLVPVFPATQIVDLAGRRNGVLAIGYSREEKPGVWVSP